MNITAHIYPKALNGSVTPPQVARKLDELMVLAGWERVFVDANAIGTGSATSPQFNAVAYTASTSFGVIVYRMPLAGLTNRWIVRVDWRWGTTSGQAMPLITTATDSDSSGNLTGASLARGIGPTGWTSTTVDHVVVAGARGFALVNGQARITVERRRTVANEYHDDLVIIAIGGGGVLTGWQNNAGCRNVRRSWTTGEFSERWTSFEQELTAGTNSMNPPSTTSTADGNVGYPIGPFPMSGGRGGSSRFWMEMGANDGAFGVEQTFTVDGGSAMYYCQDGTGTISASGSKSLFAKS